MEDSLSIMLAAALLDALLGDPPAWPHLIRLLGWTIGRLETLARRRFPSPSGLRLAGGLMCLAVVGGSWLAVWGLLSVLSLASAWAAWVAGVLIAFQCLAAGQLYREARAVLIPLEKGDLEEARRMLSMIVGRDTAALSAEGVRRGVVETVAENLNDGVVAPLFYLALGGPALALAYKAVNTLDSMVGYKNDKYRDLGLIPARLDDVAGFVPARLTALLLVAAAPLMGLDPRAAWRSALDYHSAHKSPNSGWPEAAMAGALDLRLGGPNFYHGELVEKPWINPRGRDPRDHDARLSLDLMAVAAVLATALCLALAALL